MTTATVDRPNSVEPPIQTHPSAQEDGAAVDTKELVIVSWSGELDRVWPMLILSSTAAASAFEPASS